MTEPLEPYGKKFGSLRVGVRLALHVDPSEIEEAFEFAKTWCEDKVSAIVDENLKAIQGE